MNASRDATETAATTRPAPRFRVSAVTGRHVGLAAAWVAALWIAFEFTWYQQYKLTGETLVFNILSEYFATPGGEKPFRLFVAGMEIVATILVLIPRTQAFGGLFAMGIMSGAIVFHLFTPLGIDPFEDGGTLFKEAVFTWAMGLLIVLVRREELLALARRLLPRSVAGA